MAQTGHCSCSHRVPSQEKIVIFQKLNTEVEEDECVCIFKTEYIS